MTRGTRTAPPEDSASGTAPTDTGVVDTAAIRRWFVRTRTDLAAYSVQIDALNVFPVADRDTGSNLLATWDAACAALPSPHGDETFGEVLGAAARGALLGARGNSGAVLCQVLQGLAASLEGSVADGLAMAAALRNAAKAARTAFAEPVEGTIVTVADAAASAAHAAEGGDAGAVLTAADGAARAALVATTAQLAALREAGVVDAGASGFVVVLAALRASVHNADDVGDPLVIDVHGEAGRWRAHGAACREPTRNGPHPDGHAAAREEVQYLLAADHEAVAQLRDRLTRLGDSIAIAGGPELWHVHVHTAEVGPVVEAGISAGALSRLVVARLEVSPDDVRGGLSAEPTQHRVLLAVAPGDGLARLFAAAGAQPLQFPSRPDSGALRDAMVAAGTAQLVLLPNDADLVGVAHDAAHALRELGHSAVVVPSRSPVQGLAALAVADPHMPFADEVVAMTDAAGATRVGELSIAALTAVTSAGMCHRGDVLAVQAGDVVLVGRTLFTVACQLLDRLLEGGGELVTLVTGLGAPPELALDLTAYLETTHPFASVTVYDGGQPRYPLLVGVE